MKDLFETNQMVADIVGGETSENTGIRCLMCNCNVERSGIYLSEDGQYKHRACGAEVVISETLKHHDLASKLNKRVRDRIKKSGTGLRRRLKKSREVTY